MASASPSDAAPPTASAATPKSPEERLAAAEAKREVGNEKFRQGDVAGAQKEYEDAHKLLDLETLRAIAQTENIELAARSQGCHVPLLLNLALCYLKPTPEVEGYKALECCEEVLDFEPENVKATFRKGKALIELQEFKEADYELSRAVQLAPSDNSIRQELQALRARMRAELEKERETFQGLFDKAPGFNSDQREDTTLAAEAAEPEPTGSQASYSFLRNPETNPFTQSSKPAEEARDAAKSGRLEDAVFALEAAILQSAKAQDPAVHYPLWIELGRLFMDMNSDALAIRCFNQVVGLNSPSEASAEVRRNALLLRAICLLNEAEKDATVEVDDCLSGWLEACLGQKSEQESADAAVLAWRAGGVEKPLLADAAIAQGLTHLTHGREEAVEAFCDALLAPGSSSSCFGCYRASATRWNMLAAVLANRSRHEHALAAYEQALIAQPHYPRALYNRGIALMSLGQCRDAAACFANSLEILPSWLAPMVWPMLKKAVEDDSAQDAALAEAAQDESIPRLRELLGSPLPSTAAKRPTAEVLRGMGCER